MEIIEMFVIYIAVVVTIIAFRQREKQSGGGIGNAHSTRVMQTRL